MVPFFGTNVTQSIDDNSYNQRLGQFTGVFSDDEYKSKEEVLQMFKPEKQTGGISYKIKNDTSMKNRYNPSLTKNNQLPFNQVKVGSGLGLNYNDKPQGGYQQLETLTYALPRTQDETRTANNLQKTHNFEPIIGTIQNPNNTGQKYNFTKDKKITYEVDRIPVPNSGYSNKNMCNDSVQPIYTNNRLTTSNNEYYSAPGKIISSEMNRAKVEKSKRSVLDNIEHTRNFATNTKNQKNRSSYKNPEITNKEIISKKGGNDFRNIISTTQNTINNMLFKPRKTNKETLVYKTTQLNCKGNNKTTKRNNQPLNRTIKESTLREAARLNINSNRKNTMYRNKQKLRTTNKELFTAVHSTNHSILSGRKKDSYTNQKYMIPSTNRQNTLTSYHGNAANTSNDAYKIIDETFVPRNTSKQQLSNNEYIGGGNSSNKREQNRYAEENMEQNEIKEIISEGREHGLQLNNQFPRFITVEVNRNNLDTDDMYH